MGIADSRLRDQVIFVEGAPRSGTTLLTMLLLSHPEIAGAAEESHLFDMGMHGLFDNFEDETPNHTYLAAYLDRPELVDGVRELADAALEGMRRRMAPHARFVLEKTPTAPERPEVPLSRKLECYPDAWYVHIVRNRGQVVRSSMRAGWHAEDAAAEKRWRDGVAAVRSVLSGRDRYREVRYEDLVDDPGGVTATVLEWLGLAVDDDLRERIELLAGERVAQIAPKGPDPAAGADAEAGIASPSSGSGRRGFGAGRLRRWAREAAPSARRLGYRLAAALGHEPASLARRFVSAVRAADIGLLRGLTDPEVEVTVRTGAGDARATGAQGLELLAAVGREVWGRPFAWQSGFAVSAKRTFTSILFSGMRDGDRRIDLSFSLSVRGGRIGRVVVLSAGELAGRPLAAWEPGR